MYRCNTLQRLLAVAMIVGLPATLSGCGALLLMDEMLFGPTGTTAPAAPAPGVYGDAQSSSQSPVSGATCALDEEAWTMLATGQDSSALATFGEEIDLHPADGLPVVGYALSAAAMGDLGCGTSTMRWVLRHDPQALTRVPVSSSLRHRLESLATSYHESVLSVDLDRPTLQMLGALYYLMDDLDSARSAATLSRRLGDRSVVVENLVSLIDTASIEADTASPSSHVAGGTSSATPIGVEPVATRRSSPPPAASTPVEAHAAPEPPSPVEAHASPEPPSPEAASSVLPPPAVLHDDPQSSSPPPVMVSTLPDAADDEATAPVEPVDYDRLRDELLEMSDTLDRFTRKLLGAIEKGGLSSDAKASSRDEASGS